jgi:hypothetical protein
MKKKIKRTNKINGPKTRRQRHARAQAYWLDWPNLFFKKHKKIIIKVPNFFVNIKIKLHTKIK